MSNNVTIKIRLQILKDRYQQNKDTKDYIMAEMYCGKILGYTRALVEFDIITEDERDNLLNQYLYY